MNEYLQQYVATNSSLDTNSGEHDNSTEMNTELPITNEEFLNPHLAGISVANLMNVITRVNKPVNDKLDKINEGYDKRMSGLEGKIKILETENNRKGEKIETQKLW